MDNYRVEGIVKQDGELELKFNLKEIPTKMTLKIAKMNCNITEIDGKEDYNSDLMEIDRENKCLYIEKLFNTKVYNVARGGNTSNSKGIHYITIKSTDENEQRMWAELCIEYNDLDRQNTELQ